MIGFAITAPNDVFSLISLFRSASFEIYHMSFISDRLPWYPLTEGKMETFCDLINCIFNIAGKEYTISHLRTQSEFTNL